MEDEKAEKYIDRLSRGQPSTGASSEESPQLSAEVLELLSASASGRADAHLVRLFQREISVIRSGLSEMLELRRSDVGMREDFSHRWHEVREEFSKLSSSLDVLRRHINDTVEIAPQLKNVVSSELQDFIHLSARGLTSLENLIRQNQDDSRRSDADAWRRQESNSQLLISQQTILEKLHREVLQLETSIQRSSERVIDQSSEQTRGLKAKLDQLEPVLPTLSALPTSLTNIERRVWAIEHLLRELPTDSLSSLPIKLTELHTQLSKGSSSREKAESDVQLILESTAKVKADLQQTIEQAYYGTKAQIQRLGSSTVDRLGDLQASVGIISGSRTDEAYELRVDLETIKNSIAQISERLEKEPLERTSVLLEGGVSEIDRLQRQFAAALAEVLNETRNTRMLDEIKQIDPEIQNLRQNQSKLFKVTVQILADIDALQQASELRFRSTLKYIFCAASVGLSILGGVAYFIIRSQF